MTTPAMEHGYEQSRMGQVIVYRVYRRRQQKSKSCKLQLQVILILSYRNCDKMIAFCRMVMCIPTVTALVLDSSYEVTNTCNLVTPDYCTR